METHLWGRRDNFLYDQEEHSEWHQHRCGKGQFLSFIWRQIKHQHGQKGEAEARDDEEQGVEQGQSLKDEGVGNKWVPVYPIPPAPLYSCGIEDLPLAVIKEVFTVHVMIHQDQVHHVSIVSPGTKLHGAVLPVKGKEGDIHGAGGLIASRWCPCYGTVPAHNGLSHQRSLKATVRTGRQWEGKDEVGRKKCSQSYRWMYWCEQSAA